MSVLVCDQLSIGYEGKKILDNINFTVQKGDYVCIVGENGSGKTTLMKCLLHLLKPLAGKIIYENTIENQIGYLPQQANTKSDFPASVEEVVQSGCLSQSKLRLFYSKKEHQQVAENMKKLGILELRKKNFATLSGGQKQRVLLARALCAADGLLLLDEPVTGLDPIVTKELYHLVSQLNKEDNITIIMISHDIKSAIAYGNKILHLDHDNVFFGTVETYQKTLCYKKMIGGNQNDN